MTSAPTRTMSLDKLPLEIILGVVTAIDDFQSLAALVSACPRAFRLFSTHGGKILDKIQSRTQSIQVEQLVKSIALLRSSPATFFDTNGLTPRELVCHHLSPPYPDQIYGHLDLPSMSNSCQRKPDMVYKLLATLRKTQLLAQEATRFFRQNLLVARPEHLANPTDKHLSEARQLHHEFQGQSYRLEFGPLQWTEQQRMYRALLRLLLLHEMKMVLSQGQLSDLGFNQLLKMGLYHFIEHKSLQLDELMAMFEFLDHGQRHPPHGPIDALVTLSSIKPLPPLAAFNIQNHWHREPFGTSRPADPDPLRGRSTDNHIPFGVAIGLSWPMRNLGREHSYRFGMPFWDWSTLKRIQSLENTSWPEDIELEFSLLEQSLLTPAEIQDVQTPLPLAGTCLLPPARTCI